MNTSGRLPLSPSTCPTSRSARVSVGSTLVPTPISPPGTANLRSFCSAYSDKIFEKIGSHCMKKHEAQTHGTAYIRDKSSQKYHQLVKIGREGAREGGKTAGERV